MRPLSVLRVLLVVLLLSSLCFAGKSKRDSRENRGSRGGARSSPPTVGENPRSPNRHEARSAPSRNAPALPRSAPQRVERTTSRSGPSVGRPSRAPTRVFERTPSPSRPDRVTRSAPSPAPSDRFTRSAPTRIPDRGSRSDPSPGFRTRTGPADSPGRPSWSPPERGSPRFATPSGSEASREFRGTRTAPVPRSGYRPAERSALPRGDRDVSTYRGGSSGSRTGPAPGFRSADGSREPSYRSGDRLPAPSARADRYRGGTDYGSHGFYGGSHPPSRRHDHGRPVKVVHRHYYPGGWSCGYLGPSWGSGWGIGWGSRSGWHVGIGYGSGWSYYFGLNLGWYCGYDYVRPTYGWWRWPCWWPEPVTVAYVPYGFYVDRPVVLVEEVPVYVEREVPVYVEREVPVYVDGSGGAVVTTGEAPSAEVRTSGLEPAVPAPPEQPEAEGQEEPEPPFDATTERYLREGSQAFAEGEYGKAAEAFRMAVAASPNAAAPRFAFGQALVATGDYAYAARILRSAVLMEPAILKAPGSIVGVYRDPAEFDRVLGLLRRASLERPDDPDLLFLVGYQQYVSGDPQAKVSFDRLAERFPEDPMLALFRPAVAERFEMLSNLPPVNGSGEPGPAGGRPSK